MDAEVLKIKYYDDELTRMEITDIGDWIDLRCSVDIDLVKDEYRLIPLGFAMKLPDGYEAHICPRSSTFKNFRVIQTNGIGIIDNSYCGNNDEWQMPVYAMEDTHISKNDRICQFRIIKKQPKLFFQFVEDLDGVDRGGIGVTGIK